METDLDTFEQKKFEKTSHGDHLHAGTMAEARKDKQKDKDEGSEITQKDKDEGSEITQKSPSCNPLDRFLGMFGGIFTKKTSQSFGLLNIGNSCYMNATLQCLRSTEELKDFFTDRSRFIFLNEFGTAMNSMWEGRTREINLDRLKSLVAQFRGTSQEDCQEYLTAVLEMLHTALKSHPNCISCASGDSRALATQADECWLDYLSSHGNSIVVDTFEGHIQTHLRCQQCNAVSKRFDPFAFIATPIPNTKTEESLHNCIKQFMSKESIENWGCQACKNTVTVERSISISKAPKVLLIHLKRFHQDTSGKRHKIETFVNFPFELDISEHCQSGDGSQHRCVYDLFAVIHHLGTISCGHYIACCKDRGSDRWQRYNDERVTACSKDDVVASSAYVLFYHARDEPNRDEPNRDGPNRDEPNRDGPNRDGPNRDGPNRDGPNRDGVSTLSKSVQSEDSSLSDQNLQIKQLRAELDTKNSHIVQLQKLLEERDKEIESFKFWQ